MTELRTGISPTKIIAVTAVLIVIGAVVGALTSITALAIVALVQGVPGTLHRLPYWLPAAGVFGGLVGGILAPVEAWILLRRVPLWKAITQTAVGTLLGALAFSLVAPPGPILGAVIGFTLAAIRLRVTTGSARVSEPRGFDALPP
jgi:hypothetical protein